MGRLLNFVAIGGGLAALGGVADTLYLNKVEIPEIDKEVAKQTQRPTEEELKVLEDTEFEDTLVAKYVLDREVSYLQEMIDIFEQRDFEGRVARDSKVSIIGSLVALMSTGLGDYFEESDPSTGSRFRRIDLEPRAPIQRKFRKVA